MPGIEERHEIPHAEATDANGVPVSVPATLAEALRDADGSFCETGQDHASRRSTTRAIQNLEKARRLRRSGGTTGRAVAGILESEARAALKPRADLVVSCGEALPAATDPGAVVPWVIRNTLQDPTAVAADASEARTQRAAELGVLELAVDAAESVGAQNAIEKMLAHQLAAAHDSSMQLLKRAFDPKNPPVEVARLTNAASRLMQVYHEGLLALHRIRSGGRQVIRVEKMLVTHGGQAVVGSFSRGARGKEGEVDGDGGD